MDTGAHIGRFDLPLAIAATVAFCAAIAAALISSVVALAFAGLGLATLLFRNSRRARRLASRNRQLARNVAHLEVAQGLAGIGRWCIELPEERHLWSEEMCHIAGLPKGTAPTQELLACLMPDGLSQLRTTLGAHSIDPMPYVVEFDVILRTGEERVLRARARNDFGPDGDRERVFMVVRDVTDEYAVVRRVEAEKKRALELAAEAQKEANTDALTGLASRRAIMASLDRSILEAQRSGSAYSIVIFDIDHFKRINDLHGHAVGDRVLTHLSQIVVRQARGADAVGRVGGEEFLWLLPDCDAKAAYDAAERLRWAIEAGTHSAPIPEITISAGHATLLPGEGALTLFARADAALYEAKRNGRNRVADAA